MHYETFEQWWTDYWKCGDTTLSIPHLKMIEIASAAYSAGYAAGMTRAPDLESALVPSLVEGGLCYNPVQGITVLDAKGSPVPEKAILPEGTVLRIEVQSKEPEPIVPKKPSRFAGKKEEEKKPKRK